MKIIEVHHNDRSGDRTGHECIGRVDVEINEHIRLYKLRVLQMRNGNYRIYAPFAGNNLTASFSPELAEELTQMALQAIGVSADAA